MAVPQISNLIKRVQLAVCAIAAAEVWESKEMDKTTKASRAKANYDSLSCVCVRTG